MKFKELINLRGQLDKKTNTIISMGGLILLMLLWAFITEMKLIPPKILPSPFKVILAFKELHFQDALIRNTTFSLYLNIMGYLEAVVISLLIGFPMGLFPGVRSLLSKYINAFRFVPLTAVTGIFIAWFGIYHAMKIHFLAFGIMVYLIPTIIQRIEEIDDIYDQTAITLGASMWQRIWHVFIPGALSKLTDDIRVMTAISWTYIVVAEMINAQGGIGMLSWVAGRQVRIDKVFAILLVIVVIGILQDKLFVLIDKKCFKHKYI
jgi:NitT/TauT family transport system permease protein